MNINGDNDDVTMFSSRRNREVRDADTESITVCFVFLRGRSSMNIARFTVDLHLGAELILKVEGKTLC